MKCNNCDNEVPEGTNFCPNCGKPMVQQPVPVQPGAQTPRLLIIVIAAAIALLGLGVGIYFIFSNHAQHEAEASELSEAFDADEAEEANTPPGQYPFTSQREVTVQDLAELSPATLRLMRNEIYARHGKIFQSKDLTDYFSKEDWYQPTAADVQLTEVEKRNADFILQYELRLKIVPIVYHWVVSTTTKQPFTAQGFTRFSRVYSADGYYRADPYGTSGVQHHSQNIMLSDSRQGHVGSDGFTGLEGQALAIYDIHAEDFSPTMIVYADASMNVDFEKQLRSLGFHYQPDPVSYEYTHEKIWFEDTNAIQAVFGTTANGHHYLAIGYYTP